MVIEMQELELIEAMQENYITYFRVFAGLPGVTFEECEDIIWFANADQPPGNTVLRTRLNSGHIEAQLERIMSQIGQDTDHIEWQILPGCQPADLAERLAARGLTGYAGMEYELVDLTTLPTRPATQANFRIEQVTNDQELTTWLHASAAGFETGIPGTQIYYDAYARHGFGSDAISLHYVGYLDDEPVTSSTLLLANGIAGIYDVSTPPPFRRQGFGGTITWDAMRVARDRGYRYAWLTSSAMAAGVYHKLGFSAYIRIPEYLWEREK